MNTKLLLSALLSVATIASVNAESGFARIGNGFTQIGGGVADLGKSAWNSTKSAADTAWNVSPKNMVNRTFDATRNFGSTVWDSTRNATSTTWDATKRASNRTATFITHDAPDYARNNPWKTTGFVAGGVVATAGLYWVGNKVVNWWYDQA